MFSQAQKAVLITIGVIFFAFIGILVFFNKDSGAVAKQNIILTVWGTHDTPEVVQEIFNGFHDYFRAFPEMKNVNVQVNYTQVPTEQYETVLLDALAQGKGPDVFFIENTWVPRYQSKVIPVPEGTVSVDDFRQLFVPVASDDLVIDNQIYSMPMYVDSLALYYNTDFYRDNGGGTERSYPHATWDGIARDVTALTIRDSVGDVVRGGIAMGGADEVARGLDIFSLLLLQFGGNYCDPLCEDVTLSDTNGAVRPAAQALETYFSFAEGVGQPGGWTDTLTEDVQGNSGTEVDAFLNGTVAAIIGYGDLYPELKLRRTSDFNFNVTEIPQVTDPETAKSRTTLAHYWTPVVSATSANAWIAWPFISYVTLPEQLTAYHAATGRPASRQDLVTVQQTEPDLGIFAKQAKYARSVRVYDHQSLLVTFNEAMDDLLDGDLTPPEALDALEQSISDSLKAQQFLQETTAE